MSRIGKLPISIPAGVTVKVNADNLVTVKGPKGELNRAVDVDMKININDTEITVERPTDGKRHRSLHGLYRSLIAAMVEGVSNGFVKELELVGVGYRASNTGQLLELALGYSHPIWFYIPDEVKIETKTDKGRNPLIRLESIDKQLVGQVAAKIRSFRRPEPYKGKGVKYVDEIIRRKAGKTSK